MGLLFPRELLTFSAECPNCGQVLCVDRFTREEANATLDIVMMDHFNKCSKYELMCDSLCRGREVVRVLRIESTPVVGVDSFMPDSVDIVCRTVTCPVCAWKIIEFAKGDTR